MADEESEIRLTDIRLEDVVRLWRRSGRSEGTIHQYTLWVRRYQAYCFRQGIDQAARLSADGVARFARDYVGPRTHRQNSPEGRDGARNALRAWSWALRLLGHDVPDWRSEMRVLARLPSLLHRYSEYRMKVRGVAASTLDRDVKTATLFLSVLRSRRRTVANMRVSDLDAFVARVSRQVSARTAADTCSSLRAFLRFLHTISRARQDFASCVIAPRARHAARLPRALPWPDVRRLLKSIDRESLRGRRDFAILLPMASCDLGTAEICSLRLESVDWAGSILHVIRPKTGVPIELPLLPAVARALAGYIQRARPSHAIARELFVTSALPHTRLTGSAIRHLLRKHALAAGIKSLRVPLAVCAGEGTHFDSRIFARKRSTNSRAWSLKSGCRGRSKFRTPAMLSST
ncbi:MAG: site-specific integrase [Candidatus Wallbacteria bacterium]|nr:site-specific integrase [Candidatus Wallbacteria bacterium]